MAKAKAQGDSQEDESLEKNHKNNISRTDQTKAENKSRFLEAFEQNKGLVYRTCRQIGIDPTTYYRYLDEDPDFDAAVKEILQNQIDDVEGGLLSMIGSDQEKIRLAATDIYLKAKAKDRGYGTEKRQQELSGEIKQTSTVEVTVFEMPNNGTYEGQRSPIPDILSEVID